MSGGAKDGEQLRPRAEKRYDGRDGGRGSGLHQDFEEAVIGDGSHARGERVESRLSDSVCEFCKVKV